jgi:hypothetical protein
MTMRESERSERAAEYLGICGCGDPESALEAYHWALASAMGPFPGQWKDIVRQPQDESRWAMIEAQKDEFRAWLASSELGWVLLYSLDARGLVEHGTSAWCYWLTDRGKVALQLLNEAARGAI